MRTCTLLLLLAASASAQSAKPEMHAVKIGEHTFTLPKGFTIEKVAGTPLIERPVNGSFDDKGRLYVTDSSGSNDKPTEQVKNPTHRVIRLESSKKDGIFDKAVVFADKLSFLEGALWFEGSLYVAAPPVILKLTDTDGDGIADKREVWFDGKTLTGCANDLHGPYLGPDRKIYWTKGAFAEQEHTLKDGKKFKTRASHIFRADPDGKNLEVVMTGGMDNPVGIAWSYGELFFTTTFFQHPAAGERDGIIHNTYGAVYGKDHDVLDGPIRTGPKLSEPMTHLGPAAPSGLVTYPDDWEFGDAYSGSLFCAQFNMAKVSRHMPVPKGATYWTNDSDFVSSDNRDFHPTDVIVAKDGSLLIIDTGGWYKLCCPSAQLTKKDVLGAVYRVRKIKPEKRTIWLTPPPPPPDFQGDSLKARAMALEIAIGSPRQKTDPTTVLAALDQNDNDAVLDAGFTRLLIDLGNAKRTRAGLAHKSPRVIRAALAALEQIPDAKLTAEEVRPHLSSQEMPLRDTAWWIVGRHPEWGKDLAVEFGRAIRSQTVSPELIIKFAGGPEVQEMLAGEASTLALEIMRRANLKAPPAIWMELLADTLMTPGIRSNTEWLVAALTTLRSFPAAMERPAGLDDALLAIARDPKKKPHQRVLALSAVRKTQLDGDQLKLAFDHLGAAEPAVLRSDAATVLAHAKLTAAQGRELAEFLPKVSPLDLDKLLPIFAKTPDEGTGVALLKALDNPTLRAAIRSEQLKPIFAGYPKTVRDDAVAFGAKLDAELAAKRVGLDKLLDGAAPGDIRRGQLVFNSAKTNCATCHKIGYVGGSLGPDLTRIGSIRNDKDLLESIVVPSASFVRSYEPVQVTRLDGRTHSGILKKDAPDEVVLAVSATEEVRILRAEIDVFKPGTVSVMPAGLEKQITKQELADLLAFLKGLK